MRQTPRAAGWSPGAVMATVRSCTAPHVHTQQTPWSVFQDGQRATLGVRHRAPSSGTPRAGRAQDRRVRRRTGEPASLSSGRFSGTCAGPRGGSPGPDPVNRGRRQQRSGVTRTHFLGPVSSARLLGNIPGHTAPELSSQVRNGPRSPDVGSTKMECCPPTWPAAASGTLSSLCRVLCTVQSFYLCAIGFVSVSSLTRGTPCVQATVPRSSTHGCDRGHQQHSGAAVLEEHRTGL